MKTTIIVRVKKKRITKEGIEIEGSVNDKVHENSTFQLSGNYLIINEGDPTEEKPFVRIPYNLNNVVSWGTRKNKKELLKYQKKNY